MDLDRADIAETTEGLNPRLGQMNHGKRVHSLQALLQWERFCGSSQPIMLFCSFLPSE